jgi:hypothetical protein
VVFVQILIVKQVDDYVIKILECNNNLVNGEDPENCDRCYYYILIF